VEPLDAALIVDLQRPEAYPDGPDWQSGEPVQWIQTHLSHVFLLARRVVKIRKDVRLSFVDFGNRAARNRDCLEEVRLNRRLARDVYLGVAPLVREEGRFRLGVVSERLAGGDPPPEHAVVMRRLREGADALSRLERGELLAEHGIALGRALAHFHAGVRLGRPAPWTPQQWLERLEAPMRDSLRVLASLPGAPYQGVEALARSSWARFAALAPQLEERRQQGRAVEGHGDVHLQHVWFEAGPERPLLVDCLEFDAELRRIDTAAEVAFPAMDLVYRGRPDLAERLLAAYAEETDDFGLFAVVDWYAAYRAVVRAKVAALAAREREIPEEQRARAEESARRHLELAAGFLEPPPAGRAVALCGTIGSGKSSVARALQQRTGGVVIASDRVRKRLGPRPDARPADAPAPDAGLYTPARRAAVYRALLTGAEAVVGSGRLAILDATYSERAERQRLQAWARERRISPWLLFVQCAEEQARRRLAQRSAQGQDASEAGPELLASSRARFEAPEEWPRERRLDLITDRPGWEGVLATHVGALAPSPRSWHASCSGPQAGSIPTARGGRMSDIQEFLQEEMQALRQLRDEVRVQADLGQAELRDLWEEAERRWNRLEGQVKALRQAVREESQDVREAARLLAEELKKSYQHIRSRL